MKALFRQKGWEKDISSKDWVVSGKVTFLWEGRVLSGGLPNCADRLITDWLKVTFLGETETTINTY